MNAQRLWMIVLVGLAVCLPALGQGITTHKVAGNVYMLEGRGGNIGVSIGEDGILIIDTQYANMADPIRDALKKLDKKGELRFIINTHFHGDHAGGNKALGQDVPIIAHDNARTRLEKGKDLSDEETRNGLPWITFAETMNLQFNGEKVELFHLPTGHTDTDCVVYFAESNVVHMGDHFFNGFFPFIDLASGGDVESYLTNVQGAIDVIPADAKIIPGHGPLATLDDLKSFKAMLDETVGIIRDGIDAGLSVEKIKEQGLPSKYDAAGAGFIATNRWIDIVHESLTR